MKRRRRQGKGGVSASCLGGEAGRANPFSRKRRKAWCVVFKKRKKKSSLLHSTQENIGDGISFLFPVCFDKKDRKTTSNENGKEKNNNKQEIKKEDNDKKKNIFLSTKEKKII